jgi:ArsR family transcriptional regulator, zinc-responsive transcriptional repressor
LKSSSYNLIPEDILEKMVEILKAFGNPTRIQIVKILMHGELSVGELEKTLGIQQAVISKQLSILKSMGVLKSRRDGNTVYYSIKENSIKNIMSAILIESISQGAELIEVKRR